MNAFVLPSQIHSLPFFVVFLLSFVIKVIDLTQCYKKYFQINLMSDLQYIFCLVIYFGHMESLSLFFFKVDGRIFYYMYLILFGRHIFSSRKQNGLEKYDICTQYIALTPYMLVQKVSLILGIGRISGFGARPDTKFKIRPDVGFLCSTGNKVGHQAGYPVLVIDRIQI